MIEFSFDLKKIKYAENNIVYIYSVILLIMRSQETAKNKKIQYQKLPFIYWAIKNEENLERILEVRASKLKILPIWEIDSSVEKSISFLYSNSYIDIHPKYTGVYFSITEKGEKISDIVENLNCFSNIKDRLNKLGKVSVAFINQEIGFLSC